VIYLHQGNTFIIGKDTGYGRSFADLYLACARRGMPLIGHPFFHYNVDRQIDVDVFYGMPSDYWHNSYSTRHGDSLRGVFTMYESTKVRPEFIPEINENFDFIIVPSDYCLTSFREAFPNKPVFKCPLGVSGDEFPFFDRPLDRKPFTFVWNGFVLGGRKGDRECAKAFQSLKLPGSRLILKSLPMITQYNQWTHLVQPKGHEAFVVYPYTHSELYSLYCDSDVGLHPSSSEGFGLCPIEMMATGLPMIMTDCTASEEQFDETDCLRVKTNLTTNWAVKDGTVGHVADVESIKEQMVYAYEHQAEMRERGRHAAERVRRDFTWDRAAFEFEKIIRVVTNERNQNDNRNQGIRTTAGACEFSGTGN
jgi:glycosyltransferase involved in cell wall biosynthesis